MSILERLRRLIASNVNALFESLTDPGAQIDELIGNMEGAARDARTQLKDALAEDKRSLRRKEAIERSIIEWAARTERAVQAGDEHLAGEARAKKLELEAEQRELEAALTKARTDRAELEHGLRELLGKLAAVKARKETLKELMRVRAQGGGAAERYDRIVTEVDVKEAEAQLGEELGDRAQTQSTRAVRDRIEKLEADRDAEARLAALKAKMKK